MSQEIMNHGLRPPLRKVWTSTADLMIARPGTNAVYGVTSAGRMVALDPVNGNVRWTTSSIYLRNQLTVVGNKLFGYQKDTGLAVITDNGNSYSTQMLLGISPLTEAEHVSNIVSDGSRIALTSDETLLVLSSTGNFLGVTAIGNQFPHTVAAVGSNRFVVIDGYGQPQLFELTPSGLRLVAYTTLPSPGSTRSQRAVHVTAGRIIVGANGGTIAYSAENSAVVWQNGALSAEGFAEVGGTLCMVGPSGHIWAVQPADGAVLWRRMYLSEATSTSRTAVAARDGNLYVTAMVEGGPVHLFAVDGASGAFVWQANTTTDAFGFCCFYDHWLIPYGNSQPATGWQSVAAPRVTPDMFTWVPSPLRGPASAFVGALYLNLPSAATLTITAFRELEGGGFRLLNNASRQGQSSIPWDAGGGGGFTDRNQFGRLLIDVQESGGPAYTVAKLLPVNTLPDLLGHWARQSIQTMIYGQYIGGYPDLMFRPDNLVTRAETSTIIAKTLNLTNPSAGFQTKFTDIAAHWARNSIMALEERNIIGGFLEPDGSYTFRPELSITRAQEARILVRAYEIAAAPPGFQSRFTDTLGHWARADIDALEAAGYVNGFRESDGTFTYRPEQNLTRAELCTLVVRILGLTRG